MRVKRSKQLRHYLENNILSVGMINIDEQYENKITFGKHVSVSKYV